MRVTADVFTTGDSASAHAGLRLLDPDYDSKPTALCQKLSRGEAMPRTVKGATIADRTANLKAIA